MDEKSARAEGRGRLTKQVVKEATEAGCCFGSDDVFFVVIDKQTRKAKVLLGDISEKTEKKVIRMSFTVCWKGYKIKLKVKNNT